MAALACIQRAVGAIIPFCFKIVDNEILVIIYKVGAMYNVPHLNLFLDTYCLIREGTT